MPTGSDMVGWTTSSAQEFRSLSISRLPSSNQQAHIQDSGPTS